jgi:methylenetetrahydrofolate dehydrogenase (NADP+) / methenyltetrahydrofolate cyclohydrolase / formyltetrahydrofolate synthetase
MHACRTDTTAELELVRQEALAGGADAAVVTNHWAQGGAGAKELAQAVINACEGESQFKFLYDLNLPIEEKINIISREIYGADGIELSELARKQVDTYTAQGYDKLPSTFPSHLNVDEQFSSCLTSLHGEDTILVLTRP